MNKIDETLRYPTKSHKRKSANQARKRATVFGEDVFQKRLDQELNDDALLYNLIDEQSQQVLYTDYITLEEAEKRNMQLSLKDEPFRWINT